MSSSAWVRNPRGSRRHWNTARVEAELERRGLTFHRGDVLHGRQIVLSSGEIINVFPNGTVELAGSITPLAEVLRELLLAPAGLAIRTGG